MSFLAPLYALGALAIAAPIVFHLIRRRPRGEVQFSSLMFLSPTPPRLTRRSKLDHVLLLLLRATALGLLALAFARPFLRAADRLDPGPTERKRTAILIDTSASMRRPGLWNSAKALVAAAVDRAQPGDDLALIAFDRSDRSVLGFAEWRSLGASERAAVARSRLAALQPTWASTDLGHALFAAAAALEDASDPSENSARVPRSIVVVSDLQQGSRLDALGQQEWPKDVTIDLKGVAAPGGNANVQLLPEPPIPEPGQTGKAVRVRVSNDAGSTSESLTLAWDGAAANEPPVDAYVPPGESRVVHVPQPAGEATGGGRTLRLRGDAQPFDNAVHLAAERREDATVLAVGDGAGAVDDPASLLFYLARVFQESPRRTVNVEAVPSFSASVAAGKSVRLVVVTGSLSADDAPRLRRFLEAGGAVLVIARAGGSGTLAALAGVEPFEIAESPAGRDVMLGEIAFDHPLFATFAAAQFNDFTKIHFWKYRRFDPAALGEVRVAARFENRDPAVVEKSVGKGRLVVFSSGWTREDSQLARSSKFVPLMAAILEGRASTDADVALHLVGDPVPLPEGASAVTTPSSIRETVKPGARAFETATEPGIFTITTPDGLETFAVNLDPLEGKVAPLAAETLEQYGCQLAGPEREAANPTEQRQLQTRSWRAARSSGGGWSWRRSPC